MQGIAIALRAGATKAVFDTTIGIHPTAAGRVRHHARALDRGLMAEFGFWQARARSGRCRRGLPQCHGRGGSLLSVPVLVFMGLPGPVANGTNRIAILAQNLSAITAFFRRGFQ